jgi:hypothetical protein
MFHTGCMAATWIDDCLDSFEVLFANMDVSTIKPLSWRHFQPLIASEWIAWFERIIQEQKKQNVSSEEMNHVIPPSLWRLHWYFTIEDLKVARTPKQQRLEIAEFFHSLYSAGIQEDILSLKGTNKQLSPENVKQVMEKEFQEGDAAIARELGKLYNAAYQLAAGLNTDNYMDRSIENHGPYDLGDGFILVVKRMHYLQQKEIWPNRTATVNNMTWYAVYENTQFTVDFCTCHSQYEGNPVQGLRKWRLEVDGKNVTNPDEIKSIMHNLAENAGMQWKDLLQLSEPAILRKMLLIRCHIFKPACDVLGIDWRPSPELEQVLKGKTAEHGISVWKPPKNETENNRYWRNIWDPRIDFYP